MGPSGSGKSTLLQLIGGLDRPTSGSVHLGGQPLHSLPDGELAAIRRRDIGFVFQFFNLMPNLSARENVALPLLLDGRKGAAVWARADELLERLGLADRRHRRPSELSGGQMQRVAIARALAASPRLLLADEPTGNLDSVTGQDVLSWLKTCQIEFGQTIVMVTHDPKAAAYGDRLVTLRDGKIARELEVGSGAITATLR
jgi:putative ABC transport system ATP-binding protein